MVHMIYGLHTAVLTSLTPEYILLRGISYVVIYIHVYVVYIWYQVANKKKGYC